MASLDEVLNNATSDEVEIDFSSAVTFENLPDGTYTFEVEECEPSVSGEKSKNPGAPLLHWKFVVVAPEEFVGRVMHRHSPTNGKGSGLTKDVLKALNVPGLDDPKIKFKRSTAIGQQLVADVQPQKGDDQYVEMVNLRPLAAAKASSPL
jgi:hypothetical protein